MSGIRCALSLPPVRPLPTNDSGRWLEDPRAGYRISAPQWLAICRTRGRVTDYGYCGPLLAGEVYGTKVLCEIKVGPSAATSKGTVVDFSFSDIGYIRRALGLAAAHSPRVARTADDRTNYNTVLDANRTFLDAVTSKCAGVHLFFLYGQGYLVTTYWGDMNWARRYHIILPDPESGCSIEFNVMFYFYGPFGNYCQTAHYFDEMVRSLDPL